jgi:hypothetical protein
MVSTRVLGILAIVLLLVIISLLYFPTPRIEGVRVRTLTSKPPLLGEIVKNPDFIYPKSGGLPGGGQEYQPYISDPGPWSGIAWIISNEVVDGRIGVAQLYSLGQESFVVQDITIPSNGKKTLYIGLADLSGKINFELARKTGCDDVGIKVEIIDTKTNSKDLLLDTVINADDGWKDYAIELGSKYNGKNVKIKVNSYAGGPCGTVRGDIGGVDYIDIY